MSLFSAFENVYQTPVQEQGEEKGIHVGGWYTLLLSSHYPIVVSDYQQVWAGCENRLKGYVGYI